MNSPSTSARVRNDAFGSAPRRLGSDDPDEHLRPARAAAAGGLDQGAHVDGAQPRVQRTVDERQRHHDVGEDEHDREVSGSGPRRTSGRAGCVDEVFGPPAAGPCVIPATNAIGGTTSGSDADDLDDGPQPGRAEPHARPSRAPSAAATSSDGGGGQFEREQQARARSRRRARIRVYASKVSPGPARRR